VIKTLAQGEGAIEGTAADYRLASPFQAVGWRFSRFNASATAARDAKALHHLSNAEALHRLSNTSLLLSGGLLQRVNLQGADVGSRALNVAPNEAACRRSCLSEARCVAYTFITSSNVRRPCWLKGRGYRLEANSATVSGVLRP